MSNTTTPEMIHPTHEQIRHYLTSNGYLLVPRESSKTLECSEAVRFGRIMRIGPDEIPRFMQSVKSRLAEHSAHHLLQTDFIRFTKSSDPDTDVTIFRASLDVLTGASDPLLKVLRTTNMENGS